MPRTIIRSRLAVLAALCSLTVSVASSNCGADNNVGSVPYDETQAGMNAKAAEEFHRSDKQLNGMYNKLLKAESPQSAVKLKSAERKWVIYRDLEATFESADNVGGTMYPMTYAYSLQGISEKRTNQMRNAYSVRHGRGKFKYRSSLELAKANTDLNIYYQRILKLDDGEEITDEASKLKQAERAWIDYRDAEVAYETDGLTERSKGPQYTSVLYAITEARISDLKTVLGWKKDY